MSHIENVKTVITDLVAFEAACKRLGVEFRRDQQTYAWFGRSVGDWPVPPGLEVKDLGHCAHAVHVPGVQYEVGLVPNKEGKVGYTLAYDFWGSEGAGLQRRFCKQTSGGSNPKYSRGMEVLLDTYSVEVLKRKAQQQGYRAIETLLPNGKIKLTVVTA